MRKLLSAPLKMSLSEPENQIYQTALKHTTEISLNLMAVKVETYPEDFLSWCQQLHHICKHEINFDLMDPHQFKPLKKLEDTLVQGINMSQIKTLRIAPWAIFAAFVNDNKQLQAIDERWRLLDYVAAKRTTPLAQMTNEGRLAIAGKHTAAHDINIYDFDVEWFGSTKLAKTFHSLLETHTELFDEALAHIPLEGDVTYNDYLAFTKAYQGIFSEHAPQEYAPLMPATRLLAMRRPDQFVSLTNAKSDGYAAGFGFAKINNKNFDGYWHDLIETIRSCPWHRTSMPHEEVEIALWQHRALFADVFFFADENAAQQSNYIRMRDKPVKTRSPSRAIKRTKETAEMIVDRALAADDMPAYMLDKRDSIIKDVESGKSVDQVIGLLRTIFG